MTFAILFLLSCSIFSSGCALGPANINPCLLITPAEARAVLRAPVGGEGPQEWGNGVVVCHYIAPADQNLRIEVHPGGAKAYELYVKAFENTPQGSPQTVRGLGDQAVFQAGQLVVQWQEHFFVLSIGLAIDDAERLRVSKALARQVLSRITR